MNAMPARQQRAYASLELKSISEDKRTFRGIATTPSTDRMGDIVEPLGIKYANPLPLLWQHMHDKPIGSVKFDKPTKAGIGFEAQIASLDEPGTLKERLDEAWQSIKLGLVRGVSIGFRPLEYSFMDDGGVRFVESEVYELSAVTIPANKDATIATIRSIDADLLAATGTQQSVESPAGDSAFKQRLPFKVNRKMPLDMTYAEQVSACESAIAEKSARMGDIQKKVLAEGRTKDEAEREEFDTLGGEIEAHERELADARLLEKMNRKAAKEVSGETHRSSSESREGTSMTTTTTTQTRPQYAVQMRKAIPPGVGFVRLLGARFMAREQGCTPADIAISRGWGEDMVSVLRMPKDIITRAAIAAANTTDASWAGPLVTYNNLQEEFIEMLRPLSVISRIPGLRRVPFNIKVPRETAATTGYWVGQGSPKPVSAGAMDTVTLDFAKVAGITLQTLELLRFSRPNSETLLVNSLIKALTYLVDRDFLDPTKTAVTGVSPASITNGASSVTATGQTTDAFLADFASALQLFTLANYTDLSTLVMVMTQTQGMKLGMARNDFGTKLFPDVGRNGGTIEGIPVVTSENIVANGGSPADGSLIALINAQDILLADDDGVDIDVSTEASIQADSAPDSPNTASTVMLSLWQNNMVGIRCERFITWARARTGAVVYITGGNYH